ncbi:MAG: peptidoglycan DD-metalloendopeptidase family protein [candidate division Zixibacteria bacterium]|nr:peptidoglycan DD-metalloendopeptidase family protein [candidate division Zixibacteria bacterium]
MKHTTVMFLSDSSDQTHSYRVPHFLLYIVAAVATILLAGTVAAFIFYNMMIGAIEERSEVLAENMLLLQENQKLQKLEENLKANSMLLRRVLKLVGVSHTSLGGSGAGFSQDSAVMAFMENSDILLNLSEPLTKKEITDVIPSGLPADGRITRGFIPDDENLSRRHYGVDISVKEGTKMYATADGVVEFSGWDDYYGKIIILDHSGEKRGEGYQTVYGHNLVNLVSEGEVVKKGDLIALSGNTGRSTGPHIHYEIRRNQKPVNPENYIR